MSRGILSGCAAVAALALGAPAAVAATASVSGNTLTIVAGGEQNNMRVAEVGVDRIRVSDATGMSAGAGCEQVEPTDVVCGDASTTVVDVTLGAGDDAFTADVFFSPGIAADGGVGNDNISAGAGVDVLKGGDGNDTLNGGGNGDGLEGGSGDDNLSGSSEDDVARGGEGADTVIGDGGNDEVYGDEGDDDVQGGSNNDLVVGGDGVDTLGGDFSGTRAPGSDRIQARDGFRDSISCGGMADIVEADQLDVTDIECEQVDRATVGGAEFEFRVGRASIRRGTVVTLSIDSDADIRALLVASRATARMLRLGRRATVIGGVQGSVEAGTITLRLRILGRYARKLRRVRRLRVTLLIEATDASGVTTTGRLAVTLRR